MTKPVDATCRCRRRGLAEAALVALSFGGFGSALAQGDQTCSYEGETYQPGEKLVIDGQAMVCDGATGLPVHFPQLVTAPVAPRGDARS
jgi:hypothetical protein